MVILIIKYVLQFSNAGSKNRNANSGLSNSAAISTSNKKNQLQSMLTCRLMAGQAVRKVKQVQASVAAMINNQITGIKVSGHHLKPYSRDQFQHNL